LYFHSLHIKIQSLADFPFSPFTSQITYTLFRAGKMVHLKSIITTLALTLAAVQAAPGLAARQLKPDVSGEQNVGNGQGKQFITGECLSNADCASGCCATLPQNGGPTIGICSGPAVGNAQGKQGCGFSSGGGGASNNNNGGGGRNNNGGGGRGGNQNATPVAPPPAATPDPLDNVVIPVEPPAGLEVIPTNLKPDVNGEDEVGNGQGRQFITGGCTSDNDCASGCCAVVNSGSAFFGICSGPLANFQNGKQGCGFPVGGGAGIGSAN
jgi:hypothetical protein